MLDSPSCANAKSGVTYIYEHRDLRPGEAEATPTKVQNQGVASVRQRDQGRSLRHLAHQRAASTFRSLGSRTLTRKVLRAPRYERFGEDPDSGEPMHRPSASSSWAPASGSISESRGRRLRIAGSPTSDERKTANRLLRPTICPLRHVHAREGSSPRPGVARRARMLYFRPDSRHGLAHQCGRTVGAEKEPVRWPMNPEVAESRLMPILPPRNPGRRENAPRPKIGHGCGGGETRGAGFEPRRAEDRSGETTDPSNPADAGASGRGIATSGDPHASVNRLRRIGLPRQVVGRRDESPR